MTEKRSDYRKKLKHKKQKNFLNTIKSAFDGEDEDVDVNPEFTREVNDVTQKGEYQEKRQAIHNSDVLKKQTQPQLEQNADKGLRLKKKLNRAILLVLVLIILVLLALFHL